MISHATPHTVSSMFFFYNAPATTELYTLSLHDALPIFIYVGSGEGLQRPDLSTGDGVYKSTDGGKTWRNMGLKDGQQDRKSTRLNSSHPSISYAVFCLKKKI